MLFLPYFSAEIPACGFARRGRERALHFRQPAGLSGTAGFTSEDPLALSFLFSNVVAEWKDLFYAFTVKHALWRLVKNGSSDSRQICLNPGVSRQVI